jgi:hypothetical protein
MRALVVVFTFSALLLAGCGREGACELPEGDNTCEGDGDCLLAYCGVSCCPCELAVSRTQFEGTYCMATVEEGFEIARDLCQEARDLACDGVSCSGASACPHPTRAVCEDGRCHAR